MNEPKKQAVSKRKLTLHRETLQVIEIGEQHLLDGVVGGGQERPTHDSICGPCYSENC